MKTQKIKIGIVDDHQIVIDGLQSLLSDHERFSIEFATTDPEDALSRIPITPIDILLMDMMMPVMPGEVLAKKVHQQFPAIKILALSMNNESSLIRDLIDHVQIKGYVLKNIGQPELILALEKIAAGGIYFSEEVIRELQRTITRSKQGNHAHLTDRELEITRLIEKEFTNRQIAEALFISERTVETHRKNILRKTNTSSVIGLIKYAYEHKLI